jgi:putative selenate reductase
MARLVPYPLEALVRRLLREPGLRGSLFDLPRRSWATDPGGLDLSVRFHDALASTPIGPAAGPQTQMSQNILLCWLGGSRIIELKTVQVRDDLQIPRPCIDMRRLGLNVEWSQELRIEQAAEEYAKAAILIEIVRAAGIVPLAPGFHHTLFDVSVGYDLEGIRSPKVTRFLETMRDASALVDRLRRELPPRFRDLPFPTWLAGSVTLSTFHGCPPEEIEAIVGHLLEAHGVHVVVKLNPTLLGYEEARSVLHDCLGYRDVQLVPEAFRRDLPWSEAVDLVGRLRDRARKLGRRFGIKLTNTLVVRNPGDFLPASEREAYLSGRPLHVLAMLLVQRFRRALGPGLPISFSAGLTRRNIADAVALGLVPVTVCTDLLKPPGYGRLRGYLDALTTRMREVGATNLEAFIRRAHPGPEVSRDEAILRNTEAYVARLLDDPHYHARHLPRPPRKIGRRLRLFDCLSCDKCVRACPNDAVFAYRAAWETLPRRLLHPAAPKGRRAGRGQRSSTGWVVREEEPLPLREPHQIAVFADLCNACGNCDVFCPEDGGPYLAKPRLHGSEETWAAAAPADGFLVRPRRVLARLGGQIHELRIGPGEALYSGPGLRVRWRAGDGGEVDLRRPPEEVVFTGPPPAPARGAAPVYLTPCLLMDLLRRSLYDPQEVNPVSVLEDGEATDPGER